MSVLCAPMMSSVYNFWVSSFPEIFPHFTDLYLTLPWDGSQNCGCLEETICDLDPQENLPHSLRSSYTFLLFCNRTFHLGIPDSFALCPRRGDTHQCFAEIYSMFEKCGHAKIYRLIVQLCYTETPFSLSRRYQ